MYDQVHLISSVESIFALPDDPEFGAQTLVVVVMYTGQMHPYTYVHTVLHVTEHFTFHQTNVMMVIYLMLDIISIGYFTLCSSL